MTILKYIAFGLLFGCVMMTVIGMTQETDVLGLEIVRYEVQAGDTLWNIASRFKPKNMHMQAYMYEVRMLNGLDDVMLRPGQVLYVYDGRGH